MKLAVTGLAGLLAITGAVTQHPVYPVGTDPDVAIASALANATGDGRHVLLDFGADWCPDCRVLDALFTAPPVAAYLDSNFHVVRIDVGRRDRNGTVVEKYGATSGEWIPALVALDGRGRVVGRTDADLRVSRHTTAAELLAVLERWSPKRRIARLGTHRQHGVSVDIVLEADRAGRHFVAATYSPLDPGVHLYGASMPPGGIDGLGRPTVLRVSDAFGSSRGQLIADRAETLDRIEALDLAVPVYPAGAVTLRMPVTLTPSAVARDARVTIGYMGCSAHGCLPPVVDRELVVRVPPIVRPR